MTHSTASVTTKPSKSPVFETTEKGEAASVQIAYFFTLGESYDEEYREAFQEDYPDLWIYDLTYDGSSYTLCCHDSGNLEFEKTYPYLKYYLAEYPNAVASCDEYVLIDDDTVTWEKLLQRRISPTLGSDPPFKFTSVFTEMRDPE